jgi:hypothetical protein
MPRWKTGGVFMRFTIRELVLVTVVVALGAGWFAERRLPLAETRRANNLWYDLSRAIHESGYELDPNHKWRLVPRK